MIGLLLQEIESFGGQAAPGFSGARRKSQEAVTVAGPRDVLGIRSFDCWIFERLDIANRDLEIAEKGGPARAPLTRSKALLSRKAPHGRADNLILSGTRRRVVEPLPPDT